MTIRFQLSKNEIIQLNEAKQRDFETRFSSRALSSVYWYLVLPAMTVVTALLIDDFLKAIVVALVFIAPMSAINWWNRKVYQKNYYTDENLALNLQPWTLELLPECCVLKGGGLEQKYCWSAITDVTETASFFELNLSPLTSLSIPKRAFSGDTERSTFQQAVAYGIRNATLAK